VVVDHAGRAEALSKMGSVILVTGCAGFIGWKVTEFLLAEGYAVIGIDSLSDAYDVRLKQWRLEQLKGKSGFTFKQLDIRDQRRLRRAFNLKFDAVINLAARAGVRQSVENPGSILRPT